MIAQPMGKLNRTGVGKQRDDARERWKLVAGVSLGFLLAGAAPPSRDWSAALREDATAFHDMVSANHPGPVNASDPAFSVRNDEGLRRALANASRVEGYPGYLWAMREYVAAFDDGHVQFRVEKPGPVALRWPGFLTGYDSRGHQTVMTRANDTPVPLGAELLACDGTPAADLAATRVGRFRGRWQLASQRMANGGRLLIDDGNPFIKKLARCRLRWGGGEHVVTLAWRGLDESDAKQRLAQTALRASPPIGSVSLADGTRWISLSDFDSDPAGPAAKALNGTIDSMKAERASIARAPRIVLDLRGNDGGSSDWSKQIARVLWGSAAVAATPGGSMAVDWRASPANAAAIEAFRRQAAASPETSASLREWSERVAGGLATAVRNGQPLWRETTAAPHPIESATPTPALRGPVYVLTDWGCASACLDAVDLWRSLGAVQVGQETSADTLYIDVRDTPLPAGVAVAGIPMKVYRGRPRQSNAPWTPRFRYDGDIRDTAAVARWISNLRR